MSSIWRNSMGSNSGGNTSSNKSTKSSSSSSTQSSTSGSNASGTIAQPSTKKSSGNTTTKKKKTKKSDDNTSMSTGSTFFATSFIPMHSASLLKGITPIMPGPKALNQGGYLTMSSAPSLPLFPATSSKVVSQSPSTTTTATTPTTTTIPKPTTTYDSEEDLPSYSSNSSDQSDSSSDSSNSDSSDSYSSSSDSELKKKKKSKTKKSKKKDDKKEKKKPKKKEKKDKESTQTKTQTVNKSVEDEKKVIADAKKDQAIMPPPKPVVQPEQPINTSSTTIANTTNGSTGNTTPSTTSNTDPPVRTKRKYTRRKDKESATVTGTTPSTKETETQGKKKRKKREVNTTEPVVAEIISPKKKQAKTKSQAGEPSSQLDLTIYATEDDEKLFFMDRNERSKKKSDDNDLFYGKNYNHEILRDETIGIPWCFVKESELNGAEKSNSIQCNTYLDAVNQENQFILNSVHEVEDVEMKNTKEQVYEPVLIQGMNALIPIELIQNPDLFKTIFSMNTWNNVLKEEHRMFLKQFLPPVLTSQSSTTDQSNNQSDVVEEPRIIEEVKEQPISRETEENDWQEMMNGGGMRYKKTLIVPSQSQPSSKQNDTTSVSRKSTDSPLLVKTLTQLFNKTTFLFNRENDVSKLVNRVRNGLYHPSIQLEKQQMRYLLSINLRMEYHLYIECELLAKRRLSALQKIKSLKLILPPCMTTPNQATLISIEKRKQELAEKNSKISLPQVQNSMFIEQTQMEPPTNTTPSQKKEETEKSKPISTITPVVKERKKPGPKPKKKKDPSADAAAQFEFVNFKSKASSSK